MENTGNSTLPIAVRSFALAEVRRAMLLHFAHWEDARINRGQLDASFEMAQREALDCDCRDEFSFLMMAFLAQLNNGHTRWRDPAFEARPSLGMTLRPVEGQWTVTASDIAALRAGDVIRRIEGRPLETWFADLQRYLTGSPQSRVVQFGDFNGIFPAVLGLRLPERYTLEFEDVQGRSHTLTVDRAALPRRSPLQPPQGRWLASNLAYLRIPSFFHPEFERRALEDVQGFAQAACLIVDIRGNGGGNTPTALLQALMDRPYRRWSVKSPAGDVDAETVAPSATAYTGQLRLLMDCATWSAAEDFAMPFKDNQRALLIGEPTGGSTGQPYFHTFAEGMQVSIGAQRVFMPDGAAFEGVGLSPDMSIGMQRKDLYAGRDPILEAAVASTGIITATTGR